MKPPMKRNSATLAAVCSAGAILPVRIADAHAPAAVSASNASSAFMAGPASATRTRPRRSWR